MRRLRDEGYRSCPIVRLIAVLTQRIFVARCGQNINKLQQGVIKTSGSGSSSYTEREKQVWAAEPEDLGKLNGELILITLQDSSASKRQDTIGMNKAVLAYSICPAF